MFNIYMGSKVVGTAQVDRKGLYCQFRCTCKPPDDGIYRIWVSDGLSNIDLGICVPDGAVYTLIKRVPAKLLSGENFTFTLQPKDSKNGGLTSGEKEPFQQLEMLEMAKLSEENGQQIIVIEQAPIQQDNDPNPEPPNKCGQR